MAGVVVRRLRGLGGVWGVLRVGAAVALGPVWGFGLARPGVVVQLRASSLKLLVGSTLGVDMRVDSEEGTRGVLSSTRNSIGNGQD
ncbi:hypothetical protein GCM10022233_88060 [Streptomyces shaanxiensis]|uniref:Uncharacterized protein n=1 Tax=Streptomyces shaanxiensis TaxID=653357 RepID=A0ABP6UJL9_9ACTN